MKYKKHFEVHEYPITALLSQESLDLINELMGTHYTRIVEFKKIRVKRQYRFNMLNRLMRHRPGIDEEGDEEKL